MIWYPANTWLTLVDTLAALLMAGTTVGLICKLSVALLPVPAALVALSTTANTPLCVGVPTICPDAFTDRPVGRPLAP